MRSLGGGDPSHCFFFFFFFFFYVEPSATHVGVLVRSACSPSRSLRLTSRDGQGSDEQRLEESGRSDAPRVRFAAPEHTEGRR